MTLSAREKQALEGIEVDLRGSDPKLTFMMTAFARLAADEEMPRRERVVRAARPARRVRAGRGARQPARDVFSPPDSRPALFRQRIIPGYWVWATWLVVSIVLITFAVLSSSVPAHNGRNARWTSPVPAAQRHSG